MVLEISSPETMRNTLNDIELENGDMLMVPQNPRCIHIVGAVFNQATFVFDDLEEDGRLHHDGRGYTDRPTRNASTS
jgi:hypothetical protein